MAGVLATTPACYPPPFHAAAVAAQRIGRICRRF